MAKLSIAGGPNMGFEGNAARKYEAPSKPIAEEKEPPTLRNPRSERSSFTEDEELPPTQRNPRPAAEYFAEADEIEQTGVRERKGKAKKQGVATEEEQRLTPTQAKEAFEEEMEIPAAEDSLAKAVSKERLRGSMRKMREKEQAKMEDQKKIREIHEKMLRPPEDILNQGEQFEKSAKEIAERRRGVSLEEAKMLVAHGDQIAEFIEEQLKNAPIGAFALSMDRARDWMSYANNIDLGLHYVRVLGHYRRAVERKNAMLRREVLHRLTELNRYLSIPMNALIEQALIEEDLGYAREQMEMNAKAYAASEIESAAKEIADIPMSVDRVKKFDLVTRPDKLWDDVVVLLPNNKQKLATEYVLALARVNEASRKVDHVAYDKAKAAFDKMSAALQIESRADVLSSTEQRPGEHYENPFSS